MQQEQDEGRRPSTPPGSWTLDPILWVAVTLFAVLAPAAAEPPLTGHGGPVRALAMLAEPDRLVSGGFDGAIIVWDPATGAARAVLRHHDSTVTAFAALAGGCFASGGEDGRIAVWCGASQPDRVLLGHTAPIASLAATADGRTLVSAGWDHSIRVWRPFDADGGHRVIKGHAGPVNAVQLAPTGDAVISAGYDGQLRVTRLADGAPLAERRLDAPLAALVIAPDGEIVTAGADGSVRRWTATLDPIRDLALERGPLTSIAISPDGRLIATAGLRTTVTLIDRDTGRVIREILGPGLPVWSLAFTSDGADLLSGGADRAIRRWDAATGRSRGRDVADAQVPAAIPETDRGARLFRACRACHGLTAADTNLAGPTLAGIFGRQIGTAPGYAYSDALKRMTIVWQADTLSKLFEIGPNAYLPGTKMPEQRLTDPDDRRALFEWLRTVTGG